MKHRAPVLNAAILVLVFAAAVAAQSTETELLRLAAEQGEASAQFNLGSRYNNGEGVPQDYQEAMKWFRLAAEQGDADAQFNLGFRYGNGEGVLQDDQEAVKWCRAWGESSRIAGTSSRTGTSSPIGPNPSRLRCMTYSPMRLR